MTLFFTTRFHLSNLVTRGSSNKLPRAQVSLNHEWEGLVMDIFVLLASSGMRVSPTSQWRGRAGLATGSPWGGCHCRVAPVGDLLCSSSAVGCSERPPSVGGGHILCHLSAGSGCERCWGQAFHLPLDFCISCIWAYFGPSLLMWIDHSEKWHGGDTCAVDSVGV